MPVIAQYNLEDTVPTAVDSAVANGAQNGLYLNGATSVAGQAVLDGIDDLVKIYPSSEFQMDRGTLNLTFTRGTEALTGPETVLSRDSVGQTDGGYRVDVLPDGSVRVSHETPTATLVWTTPAGFSNAGDTIRLSYSWDQGGAGGELVLTNDTTPGSFTADVPNTVTMDQGGINQPWIIGAGQSASDPGALNNIDQHFQGQVGFFQLSNDMTPPAADRDGIVWGTGNGDLIDGSYLGDNDGDRVDANDALLPGEVGNDDIIRAGAGNDTVIAGLGHDEVTAGTGDDSVNGGAGNDSVLGEDGNDSIFGDLGDDTLDGGTGNDEIVGGDGNDSVAGGAGDDELQGNEGDDTVTGGLGNDTARGGAGNDLIITGDVGTPDRAYPGINAADTDPNNDRDSVVASFGDDTIRTGDDADTITAGDGNDVVEAGVDDDLVAAGLGNDVITAGEGNDTVNGDDGNDLIYGGLGGGVVDPINLADATDLDPNNNRDYLAGGAGDDTIFGLDDIDTLNGDAGNDVIYGGLDDDWAAGGDGNDLLVGDEGNDTLLGDAGNDTISGGEGDDSVLGGIGDELVNGDAGNDTLQSGLGNDTVIAGTGNDAIVSGDVGSPDRTYPGLYAADTNRDNDRDLVVAGAGDDTIRTSDDADTISAGEGNDIVDAGVDDDLVDAGLGNDMITAAEGNDTVNGDDGNDLIYGGLSGGSSDPTNLADATDLDPNNNRDSLSGGAGDDTIFGQDDDDTLNGEAGNDVMSGGLDEDLLAGGDGNDILNGDEGSDSLSGDAGNDVLDGGDGNDQVLGGTGNDLITGGAGNDTLTGGADRDNFVGANAGDSVDGSETGDDFDTLDLRGVGPVRVTYDPTNAENGTVTFLDGTGAATGSMNFVNIENVLTDPGAPDARPDTATTPEDTAVTIPVLTNDTDPNGDPLTVISATAPNGTVTINADGTLRYTPNPDYNGPDTITYTVRDPAGNTDTTTVAVTVTPVNDAPVAGDDASTTPVNTPVTFAVLGNDTDVDGDTLSIRGTPTSPNGTVTVGTDGRLTFTPTTGFTGVATVNYTIVDEEGLTDTAVWTITVTDGTSTNRPPVAGDDTATTTAGTPVTIPVLGNDSDPDGNPIVVTGTPTSPNGTVTVNPDGTLTFTPTPGFTGPTTITYTITDGLGGTDTGSVAVTVNPTGTGPDGIVRGTGNDDLIDRTYVDPTDGDRVDANDQILPGAGTNDDVILAGAGNDTIRAGDGNDSAEGGLGNDSIQGDVGNDTLLGQDGNDFVNGGAGNDSVFGGNGNDTVRGGNGDDVIDSSGGGATPLPDIDYPGIYNADLDPNNDRDLVYGGLGNDSIRTGDDADTIYGGYGNDTIDAGFDADSIEAGMGNDSVIGAEGADTINAGQGDDLVYGGYGPGVPEVVNIPDANGDLRPDNNRDLINGGMGNDTIFGMDDDDTIFGGMGNDVLDGGVDDDSVRGGMGNDVVRGGQGNDELHGDLGNDTLTGGAGVDTMHGEADRDDFIIGSQNDGIGDTVFGGAGGDDFDRLFLSGSGPFRLTNLTVDSDGNGQDGTVEFLDTLGNVTGTLNFTNIEEIVPCFTPGTLIATPQGEVPVEMLRIGDRVLTRDNGIQEIRWAGRKDLTWRDLHLASHLKPVLIRAGSLGNGLPERDMMLSPNHRVLVANDRTALYFDEHEVLVSAKHLARASDEGAVHSDGVSYLHLMFDRHEVLLSNGAWTESFQPGDYSLKGLGNAQRSEILEIFPELQTVEGLENYQAARRVLKKHEASLLNR